MKGIFYSDPGHGWLKIPRSELVRLGIQDKITSYSYQRKDMVYLEEDCDVSTYVQALKDRGEVFEYREGSTSNKSSRIRNYQSYSPES